MVVNSENDYRKIASKIKNLEDKAYNFYTGALDLTIAGNEVNAYIISDAAEVYNTLMDKIQTASDKLEKLHKRQRVGQFGQLLINNNEPVRPTRQWTFIR